jgi:hypothetical protein
LLHLPGRGFAASAVIASEPLEYEPRWYNAKIGEIALLASPVPVAFIEKNHPSWKWPKAFKMKFTTIDGAIQERLELLLHEYQVAFEDPLIEGDPKAGSVTLYERSPNARQRCIERYGTDCHACGFSFGDTYGDTATRIHPRAPPEGDVQERRPIRGRSNQRSSPDLPELSRGHSSPEPTAEHCPAEANVKKGAKKSALRNAWGRTKSAVNVSRSAIKPL